MTTSALILMITVQVSVTLITGYFFMKVLRAPRHKGTGSYSDENTES